MTEPLQAPKGTRDFLPPAMAVRRYIEDAWRRVSHRFGFLEVDGPTFEMLDLYKLKSGDEIVSQLFAFTDRGGRDLALRPEFTPTVARMVAESGAGLAKPIKWFSIPRCYRAEQPQKGRLREFIQWNVDFLGDASNIADRECLAVCSAALFELGLRSHDFIVTWNHRDLMAELLTKLGIRAEKMPDTFYVLDRLQKLSADAQKALFDQKGFTAAEQELFVLFAAAGEKKSLHAPLMDRIDSGAARETFKKLMDMQHNLTLPEIEGSFRWDISLVRGLAYYTGFVFEVADAQGENRAIAGGGRYDNLIELLGGQPMPAVGFGMGDVVLEILLRERGVLPANVLPGPDVFIINTSEQAELSAEWAARLRRSSFDAGAQKIVECGLSVQCSYRATRNIGKLLQEADGKGSRCALIFAPDELGRGMVKWRDMKARTEIELPIEQAELYIREAVGVIRRG